MTCKILLSPTYVLYKLNALEQYFNYNVYDVNAKINYKISDKQKLFFSVYHGRDNMLNAGKTNEDQGKSKLKWGNSISSVKYYNSISPSLFFDATFFYSKYSYNRVYENKNLADQRTSFFNSKSTIQEFNVKPKFNWIHSSFNSSTFGVEASRNIISPYHIEKELRDSVDVLFHSKQSSPEVNDCVASYTVNGVLNIPCIAVSDAFGAVTLYRANLELLSSPPLDATFKLLEVQQTGGVSMMTNQCLANYSSGGDLRVPCVSVPSPFGNDLIYQVEMELVPFSSFSSPYIFKLTKTGRVN